MKKQLLILLLSAAWQAAGAQNPYLPLWEHLPDGEPRVFEDPDQPGKLPGHPVMATNQNGYTDANHYQLYAPLQAGSKIETTATVPGMTGKNPGVTFEVSPVTAGRAAVKAVYKGKEKIFLIN